MMHPGSDVTIRYLRDGSENSVNVKLAEMPADSAKNGSSEEGDSGSKALEGVGV